MQWKFSIFFFRAHELPTKSVKIFDMKKLVLCLLCLCLLPLPALAEVSDGWRMGLVVDGKESGWVSKSFEGELNMGVDGMPMTITRRRVDGKGKTRTVEDVVNPWRFTSGKAGNPAPWVGKYVFVKYTRKFLRNPLAADTHYDVTEIHDILDTPMPSDSSATDGSKRVAKADGALVGRIVQASRHGLAVKTLELTVQVGNGGGQYKFMSCADDAVYDFAVEALKRAKMVRISYEKLGIMSIGSFANTDFRITRIDVVRKPAE